MKRYFPAWAVGCLLLLHATVTALYSLTHYYELKASGYDTAVFAQALYNVTHGHGLTITIAPPHLPQHWFATHFSPILYAVAPLYALFPTVQMLVVLKSVLIALAAWPIFLIARHMLESGWQAVAIAACYLFSPFVINAGIWEFREISFAPFVLAWALWAIIHRKRYILLALSVALMCIKEHYGLAVMGLGLLWAWHWKERLFGLALAAAGIFAVVMVLGVIMPHYSPTGSAMMLTSEASGGFDNRFTWLKNPISNVWILSYVLLDGLLYASTLILHFCTLPLLALVWLLPGIADAAANILSANPMMRSFYSYHTAALVPVLLVAYLFGLRKLRLLRPGISTARAIDITLFVCASLGLYAAALPIHEPNNLWEFRGVRTFYSAADRRALASIRNLIPAEAKVSAQSNAIPHLPARQFMYYFPNQTGDAHYVVLYTGFPFRTHESVFGIPYDPADKYMAAARAMVNDPRWGIVVNDNHWVVLQRGATSEYAERKKVLSALADTEALIKKIKSADAP